MATGKSASSRLLERVWWRDARGRVGRPSVCHRLPSFFGVAKQFLDGELMRRRVLGCCDCWRRKPGVVNENRFYCPAGRVDLNFDARKDRLDSLLVPLRQNPIQPIARNVMLANPQWPFDLGALIEIT